MSGACFRSASVGLGASRLHAGLTILAKLFLCAGESASSTTGGVGPYRFGFPPKPASQRRSDPSARFRNASVARVNRRLRFAARVSPSSAASTGRFSLSILDLSAPQMDARERKRGKPNERL
jgi:hypothetical protein